MADKTLSIRLAVIDGGKVKAELRDVGDTGSRSLKRIEDAARPASRALQALDGVAGEVRGGLEAMSGRLGAVGSGLARLGPAGLAAGAALAGIGIVMGKGVADAAKADQSYRRLEAVLRATGYASGLTAKEISAFAEGIEAATMVTAEGVQDAAAVLATFRSVSGETFTRALTLAQDMAAVFGGDLSSAAMQLGKALEDPIDGLTALRRVGVSFSDSQKEMIKTLVETGQTAEAQRVILDALAQQVGGAGAAEVGGLVGAANQLSDAWGNLLKTLGQTSGIGQAAEWALRGIASAIDAVRGAIDPSLAEQIAAVQQKLSAAREELSRLQAQPGVWPRFQARGQAETVARLEQELARLEAEAAAEQAAASAARAKALDVQAEIAREAAARRASGDERVSATVSRTDPIEAVEREADAMERLADAAAISAAAVERAKRENQVVAYIYEYGADGADRYAQALERLAEAERQRDAVSAIRGLDDEIVALQRVAEASAHGEEAVRAATRANEAYAVAIKAGEEGTAAFAMTFDLLAERLSRKDALQAMIDFNRELEERRRLVEALRYEAGLSGSEPERRAAVAEYRTRQDLSGRGLSAEQIDEMVKLNEEAARYQAALDERRESEQAWAQVGRQAMVEIVRSTQDAVMHTRTWADALGSVAQMLMRIAQEQLLVRPLSRALEGVMSGISLASLFGGGGAAAAASGTGLNWSTGSSITSGIRLFHAGGVVGAGGPVRYMPHAAEVFAAAPRLHSGLAPDEMPAILQRGERVIPRSAASQPVEVRLVDQRPRGSGDIDVTATARQDGGRLVVEALITEVVKRAQRGQFDAAFASRYGVTPVTTRRA